MAGKRKVLVVEDAKVNRMLLSGILADSYEVLSAENGQVALDILKAEGEVISLVMLDIIMPVMDGFTLLSIMKNDSALSSIPVVVATQHDNEENEIKALAAGANDFIAKPYRAQIIRHRVASLINLRENSSMITLMKYDRLTGLYRDDFFYSQVKNMLEQNPDKRYDIICSDIENFKLVNDIFGFKTGDGLLRHCANLTREIVADNGICGRITGDLFAIFLEHRDHYSNRGFEDYRRRVNEFPIPYLINVKFGIYAVTDLDIPVSGMCDRARLAVKTVKDKYGEFFAYYDDELRCSLLREQTILDNMEQGITQRQFEVYYQPKYNIRNGKIAGAEALVRWNHPTLGFMSPGVFIPLFEKNGFISELDKYVWEETCLFLHDCINEGIPVVPISVNVSRADVFNTRLPELLAALVEEYDIDPSLLHLEITESAYTENQKQIVEVAGLLRNLGFVIEMDDFGTGYSSLSMLSELPIDVLKLDMKFVKAGIRDGSHRNIMSFVISLAKWMNLIVIAEGVETLKEVDYLRSIDCDYVQGYYYAKPMVKEEYIKLILSAEIDKMNDSRNLDVLDITAGSFDSLSKIMLIVDDKEQSRVMMRSIFKDNFNIVETNSGSAAYKFISEHAEDIAVVLFDMATPMIDGVQLIEKVKSNPDFKNIPVIIIAQGGEGHEARALEMGADDFIAGPCDSKVLKHHVCCTIAVAEMKKIKSQKEIIKLE